MKKTLTVALPGREYQIEIQRGLLDQAGERCRALLPRARKLAVVTDSNVLPLYLERTADSLKRAGFQVLCCSVPAGEAAKCPEQLVLLWEKMMAFGMTRTDGVAALGGGVVGDLAGFAAATLLRGGQGGHRPSGRKKSGRGLLAAQGGADRSGLSQHPQRPRLLRRHGRGHQIRLHPGPGFL